MSELENNSIQSNLTTKLDIWKKLVDYNEELQLNSEETPCILNETEMEQWILQEEDCQDYQNWMPLVCYLNGVRYSVLYRNVKVGHENLGKFKSLIVYCSTGEPDLKDFPLDQDPIKYYNTLVQGANLYKNLNRSNFL